MIRQVIFLILLLTETAMAEQTFESGSAQVQMVELFTSEGCSSCPPADRWLSKLKSHEGLFKTFIPLAFHVDYWNYLGWRDEFSNSTYSQRQRSYHQFGKTQSVYTPGFVIGGNEWRGFFNPLNRRLSLDQKTNETPGNLILTTDDQAYRLTFGADQQERLTAHIAYLGTEISTNVKSGENHGKRLNHDFVVLEWQTVNLSKSGEASFERQQVKGATAVAAWISGRKDPTPIQAVGGWLAVH